jgi:hypothetical protein
VSLVNIHWTSLQLVGPTCPPECVASGQGLTLGYAGQVSAFTIQARDEYGNPRTSGQDSYRVSIPGNL